MVSKRALRRTRVCITAWVPGVWTRFREDLTHLHSWNRPQEIGRERLIVRTLVITFVLSHVYCIGTIYCADVALEARAACWLLTVHFSYDSHVRTRASIPHLYDRSLAPPRWTARAPEPLIASLTTPRYSITTVEAEPSRCALTASWKSCERVRDLAPANRSGTQALARTRAQVARARARACAPPLLCNAMGEQTNPAARHRMPLANRFGILAARPTRPSTAGREDQQVRHALGQPHLDHLLPSPGLALSRAPFIGAQRSRPW